MQTIQDKLSKFEEDIARQREKVERELAFLSELPHSLPLPVIANEDSDFFGRQGAWLSFNHIYGYWDEGKFNPVHILRELEDAGFVSMPVSLVKWDNYLRKADPGQPSDIPDEVGSLATHKRKKECKLIAPLWIEPCQHTGCDAVCYYLSPVGHVFRVSIDIPHIVHLHARHDGHPNCPCDWRYRDATLHYPHHWNRFELGGATITVNKHSHARIPTPQAIDGELYFDVDGPYPKASDLLEALLCKENNDGKTR